MSAIEQEIFEIAKRLDEVKKQRLLDIARELETPEPEQKQYTMQDLMKLPYEERNRIMIAAMESSQNEDFEVFEANSYEDWEDYDEPDS
jgi:hypothetical protein